MIRQSGVPDYKYGRAGQYVLLDVLVQEILLVVLPRKFRVFLWQRLLVFIDYCFLE